jgi:anaerobic ribonucleoside-triphosphate reductase
MKHITIQDIEDQIKTIEIAMNDPDLCKGSSSTFMRVTGYYRSVENFNFGKVSEIKERLPYHI